MKTTVNTDLRSLTVTQTPVKFFCDFDIQRYAYANTILTYANTGGLCCSGTNGLLISDFVNSTWVERHNTYNANHPQRAAHLVMFKISVVRDPKIPPISSTAQIQLSADSFSKTSNSQDHLIWAWRHPHANPFSIWGLLWQWWLSYPLRAGVKLYPMTMYLNS